MLTSPSCLNRISAASLPFIRVLGLNLLYSSFSFKSWPFLCTLWHPELRGAKGPGVMEAAANYSTGTLLLSALLRWREQHKEWCSPAALTWREFQQLSRHLAIFCLWFLCILVALFKLQLLIFLYPRVYVSAQRSLVLPFPTGVGRIRGGSSLCHSASVSLAIFYVVSLSFAVHNPFS